MALKSSPNALLLPPVLVTLLLHIGDLLDAKKFPGGG
jgi:hypothetical protein